MYNHFVLVCNAINYILLHVLLHLLEEASHQVSLLGGLNGRNGLGNGLVEMRDDWGGGAERRDERWEWRRAGTLTFTSLAGSCSVGMFSGCESNRVCFTVLGASQPSWGCYGDAPGDLARL